jgi:hypothetical protein
MEVPCHHPGIAQGCRLKPQSPDKRFPFLNGLETEWKIKILHSPDDDIPLNIEVGENGFALLGGQAQESLGQLVIHDRRMNWDGGLNTFGGETIF